VALPTRPAGAKPTPATLPITTGAPVTPTPSPGVPDPMVYGGTFGRREAERLLWRAGFGPASGQADALATMDVTSAVRSLTRPSGAANLVGPDPHDQNGNPLAPYDLWGHDHLWWLDRMVRSDQPLIERMTLIWHDWFATSNDGVNATWLMLNQNFMLRQQCLGSFKDLLLAVTSDPAMLVFLNGIENRAGAPNENYGREVMELFTLGADRGAYTETDVREMARALTGFRADWVDPTGFTNFRYDPSRHDVGTKTIFGKSGTFGWQDACQLCLDNPFHRSFFVLKLWSYFIPTPPDAGTQAMLEAIYVGSQWSIRAVVEAILVHPALYEGGPLVKPPVVYTAGLLRALGRGIDTDAWTWRDAGAGQQLFNPPNVAGWDDDAWLDTSTLHYRWGIVWEALADRYLSGTSYSQTETAADALSAALGFWGNPTVTPETHDSLLSFASTCLPAGVTGTAAANARAQRQNALRHLLATSPDLQTS
jgi:uncharacterized protein (DUF1800 family)